MSARSIELVSETEYTRMTLDYWNGREQGCDSVTVTVRRGGRVVRFVRIAADGTTEALNSSSLPTPPAAS